jgi:phosphohistidine swiveling domain-containing protein
MRRNDWDALMGHSRPEWYWTTTNVSEALPGVLTPLMWSIWGYACERGARESAYLVGATTRAERQVPAPAERYVQAFYGRGALRIDYNAMLGDRSPGRTGPDAARSFLGSVPEDMTFHPTRRRYPMIALRLPLLFLRFPRMLARSSEEVDGWWKTSIDRLPGLDLPEVKALLGDASSRFSDAMLMQTNSIVSTVHPLHDAVQTIVERAGIGEVTILTGAVGGAEMEVVSDVWRVSRGETTLEAVVRSHGFHGPSEGELSSIVWREDPAPLQRLIERYRDRPDSEDPRLSQREREATFDREVAAVVAALPALRRPAARLVLRLARERLPLRGVGKRGFLQANDVARAAARTIGRFHAADGLLEDPEDVFFLTVEELVSPRLPAAARELVSLRRARRAEYLELTLPNTWKGIPVPIPVSPGDAAHRLGLGDRLSGIGVSAGSVEGTVRVVTDPAAADIEPGEILVAPLTDPSWASIMFLSSALVVDVGGALSHAAVVARELGLPCVVSAPNGSRVLRTGDHVRVDGKAGTVDLLARAEDASLAP